MVHDYLDFSLKVDLLTLMMMINLVYRSLLTGLKRRSSAVVLFREK